MRILTIRFFAAEDGAPIEGSATLMAGRWHTRVEAKQKPVHAAHEVRFDVDDATVVNEAQVSAFRRFGRFAPWPKSDLLEVRLERATELIIASNLDSPRLVKVHVTGGQESTDFLRNLGNDFHALRCGHSLHCGQLLPGPYTIDVFDDAKKPVTQINVDLPSWRTTFVEVP
ncbi:MAG: hypothetical protein QOK37_1126 [Thermoanaerobaculia bacterium]|jgi:hypothetical protein|nr:hypothetical protein [Thermoanaerobaculia bacterium]